MPDTTYVLTYDDAPPSLNAGGAGSRQHWGGAYKEKKRWEGIYGMLLIQRKVPRGMVRCTADVLVEFAGNQRRDTENFRPGVSKPLADTLVRGGWLADDTDEFFKIGAFELRGGVDLGARAKKRTTVTITAEYPVPA